MLLDRRDSTQFDCLWCELNEFVSDPVRRIDTKEIFLRVSKATYAHEMCSYMPDDLNRFTNWRKRVWNQSSSVT